MKCIRIIIAILATAIMVHAADWGPQFAILDRDSTWLRTTLFYNLNQPSNWAATGYDYLHGEQYHRLEVKSKPTDIKIMYMMCFWRGKNENCTKWSAPLGYFSTAGVHYFKAPPWDKWGSPNGEKLSDGPLDKILIQFWVQKPGDRGWYVLRTNEKAGVIHGYNEALGPEAEKHIPIEYHIEHIMVAKDHTFKTPAHWTNCPSGWNCGNAVAIKPIHVKHRLPQANEFTKVYDLRGALIPSTVIKRKQKTPVKQIYLYKQ